MFENGTLSSLYFRFKKIMYWFLCKQTILTRFECTKNFSNITLLFPLE